MKKKDLMICAVFRDEARYLAEWICFHQGVGVEKFILFNDRSTDDFMEVLQPWTADATVEIRDRGRLTQPQIYLNTAKEFQSQANWIAFIDLDEFLFSPSEQHLPTVLERYKFRAAVFVSWVLFGSSGHAKRPPGGVLENYIRCLPVEDVHLDTYNRVRQEIPFPRPTGRSNNGKSIVRPGRIKAMIFAHLAKGKWPFTVVNETNRPFGGKPEALEPSVEHLRINHYWSKSLEDLQEKIEKKARTWKPDIDPAPWFEREKELNRKIDTEILARIRGNNPLDAGHGNAFT